MDTLVFDGDCGFCTTSVQWLFEHGRPTGVEAVRYQSFDLARRGLDAVRARHEVLWVSESEIVGGAAAISRLLSASEPTAWRFGGQLLRTFPISLLGKGVYRVVARNRQRLPGGTDACAIRVTSPAPPPGR